jgi:glucan-binding YG repeat protein
MAQVDNLAGDALETVVNANADSLQDDNKPDGEDTPPLPKEEQDEDDSVNVAEILKVDAKVDKKQGNDAQQKSKEEPKPADYYRSQDEVNRAFKLRIEKEVTPLKSKIAQLEAELKSRDDGAKVSELAAQIAKNKNIDPDIAELIAERQLIKSSPKKEPEKPAPLKKETDDPQEELQREYTEAYEAYADEYTEEEFEDAVNEALKDENFVKDFRNGNLKTAFKPIYKVRIKGGESAPKDDTKRAPTVNRPAATPPTIDVSKMSDADIRKLDSELQRGNKVKIG